MIGKLEVNCKEVVERTNQNNNQDNEEARFGQQVKQKPMNEVRKEAEENAYLLSLAEKDKGRLTVFIRLVDYMSIETLVSINHVSMSMLLEEMKKDRKQGLFNTTVNFDIQMFTPDEREIGESLMTLLDDMIVVMRNTVRIISHQSLEQYVKSLSTLDTISDIQKIITTSVDFQLFRKEMQDKVQNDFKAAETYVNDNYEKCRPIYDFMNQWNQAEFEKDEHPLEVIKQHITELKKWLEDINKYIKDIPKGILNVDGKKIKLKLQPQVQTKLDNFKDYLYNLMCKKVNTTLTALQTYTQNLSKNPQTLKEYSEFIEAHIEAEKQYKSVETTKIDIEAMHSLLRRFENNPIKNHDIVQLDDIQAEYLKLIQKLKDAEELRKEKKPEMLQKHDQEVANNNKNIENLVVQVNTGKLIQDDTPPQEALQQLNDLKTRYYDKYRERDKNYTHYAKLMGLNPSANRELQDLESKYNDRKMLWTHVERFNRLSDDWFKNNFTTLNVEDIEKEMKMFETGIMKLRQSILNLSKEGKDRVLDGHAARVMNVSGMMPVI